MKLASLLEEARTASPTRRIEWRDEIAAFGPRAIEGVTPWLSNPGLAGFAIRVIERAGAEGEATLAARVLRSARTTVPPAVVADIGWALERLRAKRQPTGSGVAKPGVARVAKPAPPARPGPRRRPTARGPR